MFVISTPKSRPRKTRPLLRVALVLSLLAALLWLAVRPAHAQTDPAAATDQPVKGASKLSGRITDAQSGEALVGATVVLDGTDYGAFTDDEGRYELANLPAGLYTVRVSYVGYADLVKYQVRLDPGSTTLNLTMLSAAIEGGEVVIQATPFQRSTVEVVSTRSIGFEQIQSNPGGNQDISRALQSLPGVSGPIAFRNDLIIRGGAPNENVFYLDGIEVPNINHFATQGSGGGPVGIIPSYMIQSVKFQTSGFAARYDNTLSSVLDFELQTANADRFQSLINVSSSEFGLALDTPIGKKLRLTSSIRRSYLDFLFKALELPFLPTYWDVATKLVWEIDPRNSITYIHIGALDDFKRNPPSADANLEQKAILDGIPTINQRTFTQGVNYKRLLGNGFMTLALSRNFLFNEVVRFKPLTNEQERVLDYESFEAETKLRLNVNQQFGQWRLNYGAVAQRGEFNTTSQAQITVPVFVRPDSVLGQTVTVGGRSELDVFRLGIHAQVSRDFLSGRLRTSFGLRSDVNSFTDGGWNPLPTLSPRVSLSYVLGTQWALNFSTGVYYKLPPYVILGYTPGEGLLPNRQTDYIRSTHVVAGVEFRPTESTVFTVEGFLKLYDNYPVDVRTGISLANLGSDFALFGNGAVQSVGQGRSYGVEFFAQKNLTKRLYGIASYTLFWSEFDGLDTLTGLPTGNFVRSAWDLRHLVSLTGGFRFGKNNSWEISARLRLSGGAPYTPWNIEQSRLFYPVTGEGTLDYDRLNQEELGLFYQLDLRIDKRWFFKKWSLNLYFDVQNATRAANEAPPAFTLTRDANGDFETGPNNFVLLPQDQVSFTPSIGVRIKY